MYVNSIFIILNSKLTEMNFVRNITLILGVIVLSISCGPGYKVADDDIKEIKNIHDVTTVKKSKYKYEKERNRRKEQRKINKERWEKQMDNKYKE